MKNRITRRIAFSVMVFLITIMLVLFLAKEKLDANLRNAEMIVSVLANDKRSYLAKCDPLGGFVEFRSRLRAEQAESVLREIFISFETVTDTPDGLRVEF